MYPQAMNNYPIAGQPQNVTQSGVPYNDIRQYLYNIAAQNANKDIFTHTLYNELVGPGNNGLSGKMDQLVNIAAVTLDYDFFYNNKRDLNTLVHEIVTEAYWCAWSNMGTYYPQMLNDPSLNQDRHLLEQWNQHMRNRLAMLQQAGLLNNNPVQNVQPWNTAAGAMPGVNQGYSGYQPQGYQPTHTVREYNRPTGGGYTGSYGRGGYTEGYGAMVNPNHQTRQFPTYGNQPGVSSQALQGNQQGYQNNAGGYQSVRIKPNGDTCYRNNGLTAALADYQSGTTVLPQEQQGYQPTQAIQQPAKSEWSSNYQGSGLTAAVVQQEQQANNAGYQPFETSSLRDINTVPEKKSVLPRPVEEWVNDEPVTQVTWQAKPSESGKVFDFTDEKQLTEAFKEIQQRDAATEGLRDDEVRVLTKKEVHAALAKGFKFEPPYQAMRCGNPFKVALHCILTKNNEIRQIITQLGEPMRLSAHLDILKPVRESKEVQRDPTKGKTYIVSTLGGVEYNRFAQSAVVLRDNMKAVAEAPEEEKEKLIDEAFDKYKEQVEKDLKDDYSGLTRARHENPDMDEDGFTLPEALGGNELSKIAVKTREERIVGEELDEILNTGAVSDNTSTLLINDVLTDSPTTTDVARLNNYTKTSVIKTFNSPAELKAVQEALYPFFKDNDTRVELEDGEKVEAQATIYSGWLRDHEEEIPVDVWLFINDRATETVNNYLKYSYQSNITIDSFAEDYEDLIAVVQREAKPNYRMILAHIDALVHQVVRVFVKQGDISAKDANDIDYMPLRALMIEENYREYHVPSVSSSIGLHEKETDVDFDSYNSVFAMCNRLTLDQLFSHYRRDEEGILPITSVYVSTSEGRRYRVYPVTVSLQQEYDPSTGEPLADRFILVRMENYI